MSTAQITESKKPQGLKALINGEAMRAQFAAALPRHLTADRFIRVATTALMRTPSLVDCTPESFMKCLLELSAWGIEPDGRRAHLIPFKNRQKNTTECTLILDWKGLAELAQRSGQIVKLHADLVCENDEFSYNLGEIEYHRIDFRKPRGIPYGAYAMAVTKDGAAYVSVMTKDEILSVRDGSQGWQSFKKGYAKQSPWDPENPTSEGEMWKKTAFRRLSKWLPLSAEFREAVERDDEIPMRNITPEPELPVLPPSNPYEDEPLAIEEAPTQEQEAPAPAATINGYFEGCKVIESKPDAKKPWKLWKVTYLCDGKVCEASTFSATLGEQIGSLEEGTPIILEVTTGERGDTIEKLELPQSQQKEGW